jgi:hypothetical protein
MSILGGFVEGIFIIYLKCSAPEDDLALAKPVALIREA